MAREKVPFQMKFDLSNKKRCSIKSFVIKETDGLDEELAAQLAKAKGENSSTFAELIKVSITYVNDKKVEQPFLEFDDWNSKTRSYVLQAFKSINGVEDKEYEDFLASGVPLVLKKEESGVATSGEST